MGTTKIDLLLRNGTRAFVLAGAFLGLAATSAWAAENVTISTSSTSGGTWSTFGVFVPNTDNANVNVGDITSKLGTLNVKITTGSTGSQPGTITVATGVSWSARTLTLDAYTSIYVLNQLSATSTAGLTLTTNDGGSGGQLWFTGGRATFGSTSEALTINGQTYTLVSDIQTLASDIAGGTSYLALANNYNASGDGTYSGWVVQQFNYGTFNGLGNTISNVTISWTQGISAAGFFQGTNSSATIASVNMASETVTGNSVVGGLVGENSATLFNVFVDSASQISLPTASQNETYVGGLVGIDAGYISYSQSAATVSGGSSGGGYNDENIGGVSGTQRGGDIDHSIASGIVQDTSSTQNGVSIGGLVGSEDFGNISNSFSSAQVTALYGHPAVGGLVGNIQEFGQGCCSTVETSFSTGPLTAGSSGNVGGLVGLYSTGSGAPTIDNCYENGSISDASTLSAAGGLLGKSTVSGNFGLLLTSSYASGPNSASATYRGGVIGYDGGNTNTYGYWDTTTTGITNLAQGAGHPSNDPGLTGLTNSQLQSGLPSGFDSTVWAENANINGGLPYLINNPPPGTYRALGRHGRIVRAY